MIIIAVITLGIIYVASEYFGINTTRPAANSTIYTSAENTDNSPIAADTDWQKTLTGISGAPNSDNSLGGLKTTSTTPPDSNTETSLLGKMLFSNYVQFKSSGGQITTDNANSLAAQVLNNQNIMAKPKVYDFSDIKIGKDDSLYATGIYVIKLGDLFNNNQTTGNEAVYARDAIEQNDASIAKNIDPIIIAYKNTLTGLLSATTTPTAASIHLDLINAMSTRLFAAEMMRNIVIDPAAGITGAGQYMNGINQMYAAMTELQKFLATKGMVISTSTGTVSIATTTLQQ
ncbi:MAG: hypothetical protein KGJ35_01900 [Patescibacteria group bacterium]|nr:hypothetical protein [Patescibacteria group bacterium]